MKVLKIATIVLSTVFVFSCKQKLTQEMNVQIEPTDTEMHQHSDDEAIQLNAGAKWKVDEHMLVHIRDMEKEVGLIDAGQTEKYKNLATHLKKNIDLLTSNCTMEGQAHDELHKWLLPFIDLVDAFSKDNSTEHFNKIQNEFKIFNTYFQ